MRHISYLFSPRSFVAGFAFVCANSAISLYAQTPATPATPGVIPPPAATASTLADKPCILAGRLNADNQWAPLARGVTLLNAQGERVNGSSKKVLDTVRAVRISAPAWVSQCNGNQPLLNGENTSGSKTPAPAIKPGPMALNVEAIYYPPVRAGGQWVELQLVLPADRLVTAAR
jgi:hypothetical protein